MAYGLQINKADGTNIYDSTDSTWLQIGQFEFPAMVADVRFVAGTTYNIGDFVRIVTGNEGSPLGERWERITVAGSTSTDPQTENDANTASGDPLNWQRGETTITWDEEIPSNFVSNLTAQVQLVDVPPDDQEGFVPSVNVNQLRLRVTTFAFRPSERVIVVVITQG